MTEIVTCPQCQRKLQVPENYIGRQVQCPECETTFEAATTAISAPPRANTPAPLPESTERRRRDDRYDHEDDDDDIDDIRQHRINRNSLVPHRGTLILTLGLIGLVGGINCIIPVLLGPIVWGMARYDLQEMRAGRMDSAGESMTRTGMALGIISTVCLLIGMTLACLFLIWGR
ncbi:MAG TPA: hypothetical protein VFE62_05385 [Gemmataceae bacterium]|nr:hypothetical protein [Gemmataceae bacterium]